MWHVFDPSHPHKLASDNHDPDNVDVLSILRQKTPWSHKRGNSVAVVVVEDKSKSEITVIIVLIRFILRLPQSSHHRSEATRENEAMKIDILVSDRFVLAMIDMRTSLAVFPFVSLPCPPNALEHLLSEVPRKNDAR